MGAITAGVKRLLRNATGYDIHRIGGRSFTFVDRKHGKEAWFSLEAQTRSVLEECGIDLVIDVGANAGQFALEIRSFYKGEIISFEPVASAFKRLEATAASDPNWQVHQFALGSRESIQTIYVSERTDFSSMLKTNEYCANRFGDDSTATMEERVSVRRLDGLLDRLVPGIGDRRIFLKMDTQGFDLEVFKGMGSRLNSVCAIQSEVSLIPIYEDMPHWTESIAAYEAYGFGVVGLYPVTRDSNRVIEYDCLLVRKG